MIEKFVEFITGFGILTSAIAAVIFAAAAVLLIVCPLAIFRIVRYILIGVCIRNRLQHGPAHYGALPQTRRIG